MPAFALKRYQQQALDTLDEFLRAAALTGPKAAFESQTGYGYNAGPFGEVPCVCLRIPTGGGKTLLAAHAIGRVAAVWPPLGGPKPLAIWLVPSDAIRAQTLAALTRPEHPFRTALAAGVGDTVRVCELDEVATLSPHDFDAHAVVVVATIQSFRVDNVGGRNVYAFSEAFEPHFRGVSAAVLAQLQGVPDALVTAADTAADEAGRELLARFVGKPRWSLANWLALRRPYLIVDEAHNTQTDRSFEALQRLAPSLVLELTATPVAKKTNVLYHVSAQELQAEHMIKLPIVLAEHTAGWKAAVLDAVQMQRVLEGEAQQEEVATGAYIRPIVLLQAQNANEPVHVEALRRHLIDELHVPEEQVKVATGSQRELDGLDLASRECPVRFIVTVQALREGWDCPFAYVLCSVQAIRSATSVEQLLGRVMRMPYATRRHRPALNKAYAFVTEAQTGMAANALADRLIDGMGFEPLDVASMIAPQVPLPLGDDGPLFRAPVLPAIVVDVPAAKPLAPAVVSAVEAGTAIVTSDGERQRVQVRGAIDDALAEALIEAQRGKQRETVKTSIDRHNALVAAAEAPAHRGATFAPVPRLARRVGTGEQAELRLVEREDVLDHVGLDLLAEPVTLQGFVMVEQSGIWELDLDGQRLAVRRGNIDQLALDGVSASFGEDDLARWVADELQRPSRNAAVDITPSHLRAFVLATLRHLIHAQRVPLEQLARHQQRLVDKLAERIAELRDRRCTAAFGQLVLGGEWPIVVDARQAFRFEPDVYPVPANRRYDGRIRFRKHYYPVPAALKDRGEEFYCALAIDNHAKVRHWVRNLDRDPGFWLPTSRNRYFPDFVCELLDGRIFLAEYKGPLGAQAREIEKDEVGKAWARASEGRCVFATLVKERDGMDVSRQIDLALKTADRVA